MIHGFVNAQELSLERAFVVEKTIDYLQASFEFSSPDWRSRSIWACFRRGEESYKLNLDSNGQITADKHLNLGEGTWEVWLYGTGADGSRITTNIQMLKVRRTGPMDGGNPPIIPPSELEQIDKKATEALEKANRLPAIGPDDDGKVPTVVGDAYELRIPSGGGGGGGTADHSKLTNRDKPDQHPIEAITGLQEALDGKAPSCDDTQAGAAPWSGKKVQEALDGKPADISLGLTQAQVGQIAKITAVDAQGKPTEWEPVDMPSGGGGSEWKPLAHIIAKEPIDVGGLVAFATVDKDVNGDAFELSELFIATNMKAGTRDDVSGISVKVRTTSGPKDEQVLGLDAIKSTAGNNNYQIGEWNNTGYNAKTEVCPDFRGSRIVFTNPVDAFRQESIMKKYNQITLLGGYPSGCSFGKDTEILIYGR